MRVRYFSSKLVTRWISETSEGIIWLFYIYSFSKVFYLEYFIRGTILSSIVDYLSSYKKFSQFNAEEAYRNRYLKFYYLLEYDNGINKRKLIVNLKKEKRVIKVNLKPRTILHIIFFAATTSRNVRYNSLL